MLKHVYKHHIHTSYKSLQGWWLHHCHEQPVPGLHKPFVEHYFSNIQPKRSTWGHFLLYLATWKNRPTPTLATPSFQIALTYWTICMVQDYPFIPLLPQDMQMGHLPFTQSHFRDWLINGGMAAHGQSSLTPQTPSPAWFGPLGTESRQTNRRTAKVCTGPISEAYLGCKSTRKY